MINDGDLINATCAVLIDGIVKGTAWLASRKGHLLTVGHILGHTSPLKSVKVRFGAEEPQLATKVFWSYDFEKGLDFAVLLLENPPMSDHKPLPVKFNSELRRQSVIRTYGYGQTFQGNVAPGEGRYLSIYPMNNKSEYPVFAITSSQIGDEGYSGSAIYCDELDAVTAIQFGKPNAKGFPHRSTVLATPLYRLAYEWPDFFRELGLNPDEASINANSIYQPPLQYDLPKDLDALVEQNNELKSDLQREDEADSLSQFFSDKLRKSHVVLYKGLPKIGKSHIARNLVAKMNVPYFAIYTDVSGCNLRNMDEFLFDLMDQIVSEIGKLKNLKNNLNYFRLSNWNNYMNGNGRVAFLRDWSHIVEQNNIQPILILDEIDELINISFEENDVFNFVVDFVEKPNNGCFIFVCKESGFRANNNYIKKLESYATIRHVRTYKAGTTIKILNLLQSIFHFSQDIKEDIRRHCDENPFIVKTIIDGLLDNAFRKQKRNIDLQDLELLIGTVVLDNRQQLDSVFRDLSELERIALWVLSRRIYKELPTYSVFQLQNSPDIPEEHVVYVREKIPQGLFLLNQRGWIEELKDKNEFKFSFGLFLVWVRKYYPTLQEVLNVK